MSKDDLLFLVLFVFFKCAPLGNLSTINTWIAWNIGQGQWVTHIQSEDCYHYDMGGEKNSYYSIQSSLKKLCFNKLNRIFLSHWDQDHYLNLPIFARNFPKVCWDSKPISDSNSKKSKGQLQIEQLPLVNCNNTLKITLWKPKTGKSKNDLSTVLLDEQVLIPGDSPIQQEKKWTEQIPSLYKTQYLVLGHHGSRTSTSKKLLNQLPQLKMAIASARWKKYQHPHAEVLNRLKNNKTPVLKTEDWGNIWFQSNSSNN